MTIDKFWPAKFSKFLYHPLGCNHTFSNKFWTSVLRRGLFQFVLCLPFISPRLPFRIILHLMIFYHSLILYIYIFPCLNHSVISVSLLDSHWYTCFQIYWSFFTGVQFAIKSIQYNYHFISFYFEMLTLQLLWFLFLGWDLLFGFSLCISFSFFFMSKNFSLYAQYYLYYIFDL